MKLIENFKNRPILKARNKLNKLLRTKELKKIELQQVQVYNEIRNIEREIKQTQFKTIQETKEEETQI